MTCQRWIFGTILTAVMFYCVFLSLLYFFQGSLLYPGAMNPVAATLPASQGAEVFEVATARGKVEAVFLPATAASSDKQPLVIFGHGNGEVIDFWLTAFEGFRSRGIGVLLVEYPGYGRSSGSSSEASIRAVMDAAYDRIAAHPRVDAARIFGFGRSLGGGAICLLAKDRPLRALILDSTFPSLDIFAAHYWAPAFMLRDRFNNLSAVAQFRGPVLVIHGTNDRLISWQQGQRLAAAAKNATFLLRECGHGCWDPQRPAFWNDFESFLSKAGILSSAAQ